MYEFLKDSNLLLTGATGFIGSVLVRLLCKENDLHKYNIHIFAIVRDEKKAKTLFGLRDDITYIIQDIRNPLAEIRERIDFIIHCAAITQSAHMIAAPVETSDTLLLGTKNILEAALRCKPKSILYLSSMEVYGSVSDTGSLTGEDDLGALNILSARSCYPLGKRMAENYCFSYFHEYGVPVKIARLAQTFGYGVLPGDNRIFAQFAKALRVGEDLVLHTSGDSIGNYCDSLDAVHALLLLLEKGANGEAYNIVNDSLTMTIREMADLAAISLGKGNTSVVLDIPEGNPHGYAPPTKLRLSSAKLRALGWMPKATLIDMYKSMIAWMAHTE